MSAQLALLLPEPAPRPTLREVPRPAVVLPRALRNALATVAKDSDDGRAFAALARFCETHRDSQGVVPQPLRKYARKLGLTLGDRRR